MFPEVNGEYYMYHALVFEQHKRFGEECWDMENDEHLEDVPLQKPKKQSNKLVRLIDKTQYPNNSLIQEYL